MLMADKETAKPFIVEELITEFEQRFDIDEQRDEELYAQYAWEKDFDKSWEQLVDKDGVLQFIHQKDVIDTTSSFEGIAAQHGSEEGIQKRGVVRNLVIMFDTSDAMREVDFKPDRLHCAAGAVNGPMTQLALISLRNKRSILVSKLGTPPSEQVELLDRTIKEGAEGIPSLQNGLEMALGILSGMPPYTTREVLVIFGSTKTFDPSNILTTLQKLKDEHVTVSAVSIAPEMYILKHICLETGGTYVVCRDSLHLKTLLNEHTMPPKWRTWMEPVLTKVGFPPLEKANTASLCICHSTLTYKAYICPQCHSKSCAIPTKCKEMIQGKCGACNANVTSGKKCPDCLVVYCDTCNMYIHEELHQCPFCIAEKLALEGDAKDEGS